MPEKAPKQELDEKTARPEALPTAPALPKPKSKPVELEFDEADALFHKRTDG